MSRRVGPGNPGPATPPTQPVEGGEEPRDNSPEAVASQAWARAPPPHPSTRMTARSSKEDTEQQHECTEPKGHKTDRFVTESKHPRDHGIRSQKEIEIDDLTFTLQTAATGTDVQRWRGAAQADQEHLAARTGYNSLPLRLSHVGRAGTVKPANRGAREVPEHIITKAGTKAKDNPPPHPEGEPLKT